jgi:hypothetical protein
MIQSGLDSQTVKLHGVAGYLNPLYRSVVLVIRYLIIIMR